MSELSRSEEDLRNQVVHRVHGGESKRQISVQLNISRWKVDEILRRHHRQRAAPVVAVPPSESPESEGTTTASIPSSLGRPPGKRASKVDPYEPQLLRLLERYPHITTVRLYEELQASGYAGRYSILAERVRHLRDRPTKPLTVRFETGPGAQAQMDWSTYEIEFTQEGRRKVQLFSYLLGYSRRQYIHFTPRQDFETTIRQHIAAFQHLGGVAATCLYDNMKVVVTRWEDDEPIYNTRFLAFATHYGYRPRACRVRRPQTKGKVERPFHYVETNLLNGRQFRSLDHLNEAANWWLREVADQRIHGTTKKTPLELHAEELPHLLPLPTLQFDTAQVVYRVVDSEGTVQVAGNRYSVPWQLVAELLPVRILEKELVVYNRSITEVARHPLLEGQVGQRRIAAEHLPPRDHEAHLQRLRERYTALGAIALEFLEGVLAKSRYSKHQAQKILTLLYIYPKSDVLAAMQRAVTYRVFGFSSLERILAHQGTPRPSWQQLSESEQAALAKLIDSPPIPPRHSREYQDLLFGTRDSSTTIPSENSPHASQESHQGHRPSGEHSPEPGDTQDQNGGGGT